MNLGESEVIQCPILFYLPHSSIHGIFQARVLEWVAISFFTVSSQRRDQTWVSHIVGRCFTIWATREFRWGGIQTFRPQQLLLEYYIFLHFFFSLSSNLSFYPMNLLCSWIMFWLFSPSFCQSLSFVCIV